GGGRRPGAADEVGDRFGSRASSLGHRACHERSCQGWVRLRYAVYNLHARTVKEPLDAPVGPRISERRRGLCSALTRLSFLWALYSNGRHTSPGRPGSEGDAQADGGPPVAADQTP